MRYIRHLRNIILSLLAALVVLIGLFCAGIVRPPRPDFANTYEVPKWFGHTLLDQQLTAMRTDNGQNMILLVLNDSFSGMRGTGDSFAVCITPPSDTMAAWVPVPLVSNTIIVLRSDGVWRRYALPIGAAAPFEERYLHGVPTGTNLVRDAAQLLESPYREELVAFAAGDTDPSPASAPGTPGRP
jgi:hypothetical protein